MRGKRNSIILAVLVLALVVSFLVVPVGTQAQTPGAASQSQITALTDQLNSLLKQLIALLTTQLQGLQAQLTAKQGQEVVITPPAATATSTAATSTAAAVSNKAPRVNIAYPTAGLELTAQASTVITASAGDDDGSIAKIEFFQNNSSLGTLTSGKPPWSVNWSNISAGTYSLTAKATDDQGAVTTSQPVELKVITSGKKGIQAPTITIAIVPANIYTVSGTSATITATTDSIGGWIDKVVFSRAASTTIDAAFQTDVTPPFIASSTFAAIGTHTISAIATNNVGETLRSASTTISAQP